MQLLSVCIGVKGRIALDTEHGALALLPRCVRSLAQAAASAPPSTPPVELAIAHWPVPGEPPPREWIPEAAAFPISITNPTEPYNRGRGRNCAARIARGDALFFLDADMIVPPGLIERGLHWIRRGRVFFPRYRRFTSPDETRHKVEHGCGNVFLSRRQFADAGGWPEHDQWGMEDREFWQTFIGQDLVVRESIAGFMHQWHPLAPDHASRRVPCQPRT